MDDNKIWNTLVIATRNIIMNMMAIGGFYIEQTALFYFILFWRIQQHSWVA